jgi:hypothetical protein
MESPGSGGTSTYLRLATRKRFVSDPVELVLQNACGSFCHQEPFDSLGEALNYASTATLIFASIY